MAVTPHYRHPTWRIVRHMLTGALGVLPLVMVALAIGMLIYHNVEGLPWPDSFLNAAMLLGGMGPVNVLRTTTGKWLAGLYALFAGLIVIVVAGAMLAPVVHHVVAKFHGDAKRDPQ